MGHPKVDQLKVGNLRWWHPKMVSSPDGVTLRWCHLEVGVPQGVVAYLEVGVP